MITVMLAERLTWAGFLVLVLTCDSQEDARARLAVQLSEPQVAQRSYAQGSIVVVGIRGFKATDVLYSLGTDRLGLGTFDVVVLDTPPEVQVGGLPGTRRRILSTGNTPSRCLGRAAFDRCNMTPAAAVRLWRLSYVLVRKALFGSFCGTWELAWMPAAYVPPPAPDHNSVLNLTLIRPSLVEHRQA